jgi:hypothetical protein
MNNTMKTIQWYNKRRKKQLWLKVTWTQSLNSNKEKSRLFEVFLLLSWNMESVIMFLTVAKLRHSFKVEGICSNKFQIKE